MKNKRLFVIIPTAALLLAAIVFGVIFAAGYESITAKSAVDIGKVFESKYYSTDDVLSFTEDSYYTYLSSVPADAPDSVNDFYFRYKKNVFGKMSSMMALSYTLDEESYERYKKNLGIYYLYYRSRKNQPIYTENAFAHPAYVFTYMSESDEISGGVAEYVLLNDSEREVINVFFTGADPSELQKRFSRDIMPKDPLLSSVIGSSLNISLKHKGFSIYSFSDSSGRVIIPHRNDLTFIF